MCRFKKGDKVKHTSGIPKAIMEVVNNEGDRVLCRWMGTDCEEEGLFLEDKLNYVQ